MAAVAVDAEAGGREDGPPLVLINSLGATRRMWDPQWARLGDALHLVRYDQRGHGASPAPPGPYSLAGLGVDLLALLDRFELERASLCGLSLGGMVALWAAARAPERVERLIVICGSAHLPPAEGWLERARLVRRAGAGAIAESVVERWLTPSFRVADPGRTAELIAMVASTPAEGYAACCEAIATVDLRDSLPSISAPTLVIAGREDPATPPEHGGRLVAAIGDARLELLSPAAHLANLEQAEAVSRLVLEHVAR